MTVCFPVCGSDAALSPDIGPLLGGRIHDQLDQEVHPALDRVLNMAGGMSADYYYYFSSFISSSVTIRSGYCHSRGTQYNATPQ